MEIYCDCCNKSLGVATYEDSDHKHICDECEES